MELPTRVRSRIAPKRTLIWDIERSPHLAETYQIWQQNISRVGLLKHGVMQCFAARWHGDHGIEWYHAFSSAGPVGMLEKARKLLDEADQVVSYNGKRFDTKQLNNELLRYGIQPPSKFKEVDLFSVGKRHFDLPFKGMDDMAQLLGVSTKLDVGHGMALMRKCLAGDLVAIAQMRAYNMQDVVVTEEILDELIRRGWLTLP